MVDEVVANSYNWWAWLLQTEPIMKIAHREQGKAAMYVTFVITVILKAVL